MLINNWKKRQKTFFFHKKGVSLGNYEQKMSRLFLIKYRLSDRRITDLLNGSKKHNCLYGKLPYKNFEYNPKK